jgi:hypothetical protein
MRRYSFRSQQRLTWGHLATDPSGSLPKFYAYTFGGLERRLGYASLPILMDASLPYAESVEHGDLYQIALRASKAARSDRHGAVPAASFAGYVAGRMWPMFFKNLTLKRAWV